VRCSLGFAELRRVRCSLGFAELRSSRR